jgi:hypothetical protein
MPSTDINAEAEAYVLYSEGRTAYEIGLERTAFIAGRRAAEKKNASDAPPSVIALYMGEDVSGTSRERLVEVVIELGERCNKAMADAARDARELAERMRRLSHYRGPS